MSNMLRSALLVLGTALVVSGQRPGQYQYPPLRSAASGQAAPSVPLYADGSKLTFVISAEDLPNTGLVSNVDPYIKVYYTNRTATEPVKFATTEVVKNDPSPEFTTVISFTWNRGQQQKLIFKVKNHNKLRDDTLGEVTLDVDDYVNNKNQKANLTLSEGGSLLIKKTTPIKFQLHGRHLPRKDPFNTKSDPFVECYWRRGSNGAELKFFTTQHVNDVENVDWPEIIEFTNYIRGTDQWLVFKVRDYDGIGSNDDLGQALVEVDPYVLKKETKQVKLCSSCPAELYITPM